jgi:hypothetical protein
LIRFARGLKTPGDEKEGHSVRGQANQAEPGADYGIDAPRAVRNAAIAGLAGSLLASLSYSVLRSWHRTLARRALALGACTGLASLLFVGVMLWSSRIGKLRARDGIIGAIPWRGDEAVLDVGCGRGLLLIAAAKRLPDGRAVGVDIWDASDEDASSTSKTSKPSRERPGGFWRKRERVPPRRLCAFPGHLAPG